MNHKTQDQLQQLFQADHGAEEARCLAQLLVALLRLPPPPDPHAVFSDYPALKQKCLRLIEAATPESLDALEEAFLELYCHLHMYQAPYTREERRQMDQAGGYWCHAGGLSPILKAGPHIQKETVSTDLGAGNGLQCLLLQLLYPHQKSIQIEISSRAVAIGRALQGWLGIEENRVEWIVGDVLENLPKQADFIYLYRPVKPEGPGLVFYRDLAEHLHKSPQTRTIFSIADCLRDFLSPRFKVFYSDGHLTCIKAQRSVDKDRR